MDSWQYHHPLSVCHSPLETGLKRTLWFSRNMTLHSCSLQFDVFRKKNPSSVRLSQPQRIQVYRDNHKEEKYTLSLCCSHANLLSFNLWHFKKLWKAQSHLSIRYFHPYERKWCYFQSYEISWIIVNPGSVVPVHIKLLRKKNGSALVKIKRKCCTRWYLISLRKKHPADTVY